ncbi:MBL fold metallo-hydrolase [Treponema sp.]|uniref:MBL fold metallo-hydrolase n=1 Tax=Treponema sp. TaxID=166 RepID=UPI0025DD70BB|nr:MBL fold metallo-hydrolase [Treponema sp.]MCR5217491.1 MBL fold metallo-hydrolase [Treponema sp.]
MKIINLVENTSGNFACRAVHGLSFYIQTKKHRILFDAGPDSALIENAAHLGIDLSLIDTVILSHGHYDHSGGLMEFARLNKNAVIYMQSSAGEDHFAFDGPDKGYRYIGIDRDILSLPQVKLIDGDLKIDEELSLFRIDKRTYPLPSTNKRIMLRKKEGETFSYIQDDFVHEHCLLLESEGKKIIISGCAHNGILNIMDEYQRKHKEEKAPDAVISGFHLMKKSGYTEEDYKEEEEIAGLLKAWPCKFYTCHCTGEEVFERMKAVMKDQLLYVHCGDEVTLL